MELKKLQKHINQLPLKKWEELFAFLPQIAEKTEFGNEHFGEHLPNSGLRLFYIWDAAPVVDAVVCKINTLQLLPVYDWTNWKEGHALLNAKDACFDHLDTLSLVKLFTLMIRQDRFFDGYLISCFENGAVHKILTALQDQVVAKKHLN